MLNWRRPPTYYKPEKIKIIDIEQPTARKIIFYINERPDVFRQQFVPMKKADRWYVDNRKIFLDGWETEGF